MPVKHPILNALSVDVEEVFHASEVRADPRRWRALPSRVVRQTRHVLELFDRYSVKGTFFILGWVAREHPELVREVQRGGHEVGCHSYAHRLVYDLTPGEFRSDTEAAVKAIEDAGGIRPRLYRAPSYSITGSCLWALEILAELGFTHDSSIYPIAHDRYGIPNFGLEPRVLPTPCGSLVEVPLATVECCGARLPVAGGAYLRLLPGRYVEAGVRRINREYTQPACIYFHPWELDSDQPRFGEGLISRLRTYTGLAGMTGKVASLLSQFRFAPITEVYPLPDVRAHAPCEGMAQR